jgi:WhiB family redox-sensing transcriptional regulator
MTTTDPTWRARAECRDHPNPDIWYPNPSDIHAEARAKAICATCPVRFQCLADANARREKHGIWGGFERTDKGRARRPPGPMPKGGYRIGRSATR